MADVVKKKGKPKGKQKEQKKKGKPKQAPYSMVQLFIAIFFWMIFLPVLTVVAYLIQQLWKAELNVEALTKITWVAKLGENLMLLTLPLSILLISSLAYLFVLIQHSVATEKLQAEKAS